MQLNRDVQIVSHGCTLTKILRPCLGARKNVHTLFAYFLSFYSIYRIFLLQSGLKMLGVWHVSRELSDHCTLIVDLDESTCPRLLSPHSAPRHGALPCPMCRAEPRTTTWARTEGAAQPPLLAVSWSWQLLQMTMAQTLLLSQTKDPRQPSVCYRDSEGFMGS